MECEIVRIINLPRLTQEQLLKARSLKEMKTEDSISGSADPTQTPLHYTVYALSNKRTEISKFFGN